MAVNVRITTNTGESEYESSCAYYYSFLFSGWWLNWCTAVALNGKYNPRMDLYGFLWWSQATNFIYVKRSEMKIRRQQ